MTILIISVDISIKLKMEDFLRPNETSEELYARCTNLTYFDCTEEEMLWCMMGPRRLPLLRIVPITVFLLLIFLTGVIGNVAVCLVIIRHPAMRTDTNYYLFSLALSDLLLLLFGEYFACIVFFSSTSSRGIKLNSLSIS